MQRILAEVKREVFRRMPQVKFFKCLPSKRQDIGRGHEQHRGGRFAETSEMRNMDEASMQYGFGRFWDMLVRCCAFLFGASVLALGVDGCCKGKVARQIRLALRGGMWGGAGGARAGPYQDTNSFQYSFSFDGRMHWQGCLVLAYEVGGWCHVVP